LTSGIQNYYALPSSNMDLPQTYNRYEWRSVMNGYAGILDTNYEEYTETVPEYQ